MHDGLNVTDKQRPTETEEEVSAVFQMFSCCRGRYGGVWGSKGTAKYTGLRWRLTTSRTAQMRRRNCSLLKVAWQRDAEITVTQGYSTSKKAAGLIENR